MKKVLVAILMLCFVAGGEISVFAQAAHHKNGQPGIEMFYGSVVSIDNEKKEIVVKEEKTGENKTFHVSASSVLHVKTGQRVKLRIKTGSSVAESVKIAQPKAKNK